MAGRTFRADLRHALSNPAWPALIWFGMTAGVSLLATPAKFHAPSLTRPVALDVGRTVFAVLNKAELVALIVLLVVVRLSQRARRWWAGCALLTLIVIAQSVWLLPALSERAQLIGAGIEPPASYAHAAYSVLELCKLAILLFLGFTGLLESRANPDGHGRGA